jgi:hypothetical protein
MNFVLQVEGRTIRVFLLFLLTASGAGRWSPESL